MSRTLTAMTLACASAAVGQILVRYGMQQVGSLERWAPLDLVAYFVRAAANPYVIGGTLMNAIFYLLFLAVLSWSEVTVALPLTALEYAFAAVLGVVILKEAVPALRWLGIALVIGGVVLIGLAESGPRGSGDPTGKEESHAAPAARES
ncbi:MAG TPA: DMT family transporter [Vicinamibacteria bacterium]|nr:DMT family transporter [Vicinamibacteria bacterium]